MPVAMITGGASWISRATARSLIADGWEVELSDIDTKGLDDVVKDLGPKATGERLDVTDLAAVTGYAKRLAAKKGGIDALVNVAGGSVWLKMGRQSFAETDPEKWDLILKPNLNGVLNCCHAVLPHMVGAKKGAIVSVASGMGLRGKPQATTYSAAKAAVIAFSQSLCQEVGTHGIRVNTVAPGNTESRWIPGLTDAEGQTISPMGRRTGVDDVANAICFLVSERASHITGACFDVSGGTSLH